MDATRTGPLHRGPRFPFLRLFLSPVEAQPLLARLHEFVGYECAAQNAGVVEGRDGRLYGWIGHAGQDRRSVLWAINRDGSGFTVLHTFSGLTLSPRSGRAPVWASPKTKARLSFPRPSRRSAPPGFIGSSAIERRQGW